MGAHKRDNRGVFEPEYQGLPMELRQRNYGNHLCTQSSSRLKPELLRNEQQTAGRTSIPVGM